jgi:hypothetical protein
MSAVGGKADVAMSGNDPKRTKTMICERLEELCSERSPQHEIISLSVRSATIYLFDTGSVALPASYREAVSNFRGSER